MDIDNNDYQPMEVFVLRWRWDEQHCPQMSAQERACIRPLTDSKAQRIGDESYEPYRVTNGVVRPNDLIFTAIVQLRTAEKESTEVRDWLEATVPATDDPVFVSWGSNTSVETDRTTFITWWDTFCYPASDDVLIRPVSSIWAVYYWHEEIIYVGISE